MTTGQLSWKTPSRWAWRLGGTAAAAMLLTAPTFSQTYCASDGGSGNTFNIDRVEFAGIDNTSGTNNGYADFTALSANVDPGASFTIDLDPNGPFFLRYRWRVWIDWNQDGEFTVDERMVQQTGFGSESAAISVPNIALPGSTRMRVNMSAFNYRDACANWSTGEVEDYTVVVSAPCEATAGTLGIAKPFLCFDGVSATLLATVEEPPVIPDGFEVIYVLTSGSGLVIEQAGADPSFDVTAPGIYTIHTLVYDPNTLDLSTVVFGETTGFDVNGLLVQGGGSVCGALDVTGGVTNVVFPNAGTLSGGSDVCNTTGEVILTATANGDSNVPAGYSLAYVLTSGTDLVIQQLGASPSFTVSGGGLYTIHTFVFPSDLDLSGVVPGTTTGGDVLALLAANNICAALDVAGAAFNISDPNAGTLSGGSDVCNTTGEVILTATANGDSNVPAGYSLAYVLTSGTDLVIQQLGATPSFTVSGGGLYTIHTFVFPSDLDLSGVVPGTTTGGDVLALLAANNICAALDVAGAAFNISDPNAGTLTADAEEVCFEIGTVTISATANGDQVIPAGYSLLYVLTEGPALVIQQVAAAPSFVVAATGVYTIHSFVYPSDLDLSGVELGVTTGFDVNALLVQGGGEVCGSLLVAGAVTAAVECQVCTANAGTLSGGGEACLTGGIATLTASADGNAVVPAGYETIYVLTSGAELVIVNAGANPTFEVDAEGTYTIHSLVYDPATLDLGIVEFGVTTGFDVNGLLVQGGGEICASLLVAGAQWTVNECGTVCSANAGTIAPADFFVCWQNEQLVGIPAGNAVVPAGYETLYVLTRGNGLVIRQVNTAPVFTVNQNGIYRIHTLVYDPTTLDLSIVQFGTTTGFDVNGLLIQGGGSICASLDVNGAPFIAVGPVLCSILDLFRDVDTNDEQAMQNALDHMEAGLATSIENDAPVSITSAWPNPTRDVLNIGLYLVNDQNIAISVIDITGKEVLVPRTSTIGAGTSQVTLDVNTLSAGTYMVRLVSADKVVTERFMKVD